MMDALLLAVRDNLRQLTDPAGKTLYDQRTCEVMADDHPPVRMGDWFLAVHQKTSHDEAVNSLDRRFNFAVTLTGKLSNVPLDRVGDRLLVKTMAETTGFNARAEAIGNFLHMAWGVIQDANNNLLARPGTGNAVYGFVEPARWAGMETPDFVGPEWFSASLEGGEASETTVGIKATLTFEGARRMQAIATYA